MIYRSLATSSYSKIRSLLFLVNSIVFRCVRLRFRGGIFLFDYCFRSGSSLADFVCVETEIFYLIFNDIMNEMSKKFE